MTQKWKIGAGSGFSENELTCKTELTEDFAPEEKRQKAEDRRQKAEGRREGRR
jgi:hypothetical protein